MAKAPPATALAALSGPTTDSSGGPRPPTSTPSRPSPQQPSAPKSPQQATSDSGGGGSQRGKRGGKRHNKGGGNSGGNGSSSSSGTPTSGGTGGPGPGWPSYHNPWAGSIYMWPGQRAPAPPRSAGPIQQPQAYFAGPGQWAGQWGVPPPAAYTPPTPSLAGGWDQQALAANFQTMSLQQPPQHEWYFDSGSTT